MSGYDEREVERYLPTLWDEELRIKGLPNPQAPDPSMPKGYKNPAHANTHLAVCADLQRAWGLADMTLRERQVLLMRYGLMWEQQDCADYFGNSQQAISYSEAAGIAKLVAFLNSGQSRTRNYLRGRCAS